MKEKVINFSNGNENGICISTRIVEASLDIDFDVLYTYMSSVDSLIQRMGRYIEIEETIVMKQIFIFILNEMELEVYMILKYLKNLCKP